MIVIEERSHQGYLQILPLHDDEIGTPIREAPTNVTFTADKPELLNGFLISPDGNYVFTTFRKTSLWSIDPNKPIELIIETMIWPTMDNTLA